ncbi:tetratricopeptide repeat protein [Rubinisphaera margarita]|uniref:tetratricopeptide repeat protein n=1 Tax=Rubinisphaera margarita TaxID=2909586 RepID=UPI001EE97A9D|nr:tetratricopeptide repeat protein [Rubinisphaera margarita]MCG6155073.1 hypothetical protein [Rubinisphaera margarita]
MQEIRVGIRITPDGLEFFGIEKVNGLINRGGKVVSVSGGSAVMQKLGEDESDVQLTLSGCDLCVNIDEEPVKWSAESQEHDRLYKAGAALIDPYMKLNGREAKTPDTPEATDDLERGIQDLRAVIQINPANWAAYWVIGKACQALDRSEEACEAFKQAYALEKTNPDVAREYVFECLKLGKTDPAVRAARHAVGLVPDNAGLIANLGLALLIRGDLQEAEETINQSLQLNPADQITHNLQRILGEVQTGERPQPQKLSDLQM